MATALGYRGGVLPTPALTRRGTARQQRAVRNDERILQAAIEVLDAEGWGAFTTARVARQAGLNPSTVSARFAGPSALAVEVWRTRLAPHLSSQLHEVVACLRSDGPVDPAALDAALTTFMTSDEDLRAAAELLVVSTYDDILRVGVSETTGAELDGWLTPVPRRLTRVQAARTAYALTYALGLLLEGRRHPDVALSLRPQAESLARALSASGEPAQLPRVRNAPWDRPLQMDTGDRELDALLVATLEEIGRRGYEAATIDDIAHAAGRTKGFVFGRFSSKRELFLEATAVNGRINGLANAGFAAHLEAKHSPGIAHAIQFREFLKPRDGVLHVIALEQARLSWHDPEMLANVDAIVADLTRAYLEATPSRTPAEAEAMAFMSLAGGIGVLLLATLCPEAWRLPFDVITVPLALEE